MVSMIRGPMDIFRKFVTRIRGTKSLRQKWRNKSIEVHGAAGRNEPPCLDSVTRWNSTYDFSLSCEKDRKVLEYVNALAPLKADAATIEDVTEADWAIMKACNEFLLKPASVRTSLHPLLMRFFNWSLLYVGDNGSLL